MDNNNEDKKVLAYIDRQYLELIGEDNSYNNNSNNLEAYLVNYEDVNPPKLREIFSHFHVTLNKAVKDYKSANSEYMNDQDYGYIEDSVKQIFLKISDIQSNLQKSRYVFTMKERYTQYLTGSNHDYQKLNIIEVEPIFELLKSHELELFQNLIVKLYDKNWDLGKTFQSKVRYKSFVNNVLTWESMVTDDEKKLLTTNWAIIKLLVQKTFGFKTKIKNTPVDNIDIEENKQLNQTKFSIKTWDSNMTNKIEDRKSFFSNKDIQYSFPYKNILLKGVPGTGKSRTIDNIIHNHLKLEKHQETNVLRINIHSASSNADLMQGIGISSNDKGEIEYKERQGLIFELIEKATFNPNQPFALVLEEIQENSLNELIGDLIYLIEDSKRARDLKPDNKEYTYKELINKITKDALIIHKVKIPNLISNQSEVKEMVLPENLFIFCTSNYRDDRKVIEDNLLRRFEVIEIYPKYKDDIGEDFKSSEVSVFLENLNKAIIEVCSGNGEIHPDRFMIGHSIWLEVEDRKAFNRAFLKVITEFKDIKDMHFEDFQKIIKKLTFPFNIDAQYESYELWIKALQNECYDFLK